MKIKPKFDIGYGLKVPKTFGRIVDKYGNFQIEHNNRPLQFRDVYHYLIHVSWLHFFALIILGFIGFNLIFGFLYFITHASQMQGIEPRISGTRFVQLFYFSTQTFTTLGYGVAAPLGYLTSMIAAIEAMVGLLYFSFATSLFYGRFSRATPNLKFSRNVLLRNYNGGKALMFRVMHKHPNALIDVYAEVFLALKSNEENGLSLKYYPIELEREKLSLMPLTWTVVMLIDEKSPLYQWTEKEFQEHKGEFIIMIRYFDETFSQQIYQRYSYIFSEIEFEKSFKAAYHYDENGIAQLDHELLDEVEDDIQL